MIDHQEATSSHGTGATTHSGFPNFLKHMGPEVSLATKSVKRHILTNAFHQASNATATAASTTSRGHQKKLSISQKSPGLWTAVEDAV